MLKTENTNTITTAAKNKADGAFTMRFGNTNYRVGVYFSATSAETARDKIQRLVKNEMAFEQVTNP